MVAHNKLTTHLVSFEQRTIVTKAQKIIVYLCFQRRFLNILKKDFKYWVYMWNSFHKKLCSFIVILASQIGLNFKNFRFSSSPLKSIMSKNDIKWIQFNYFEKVVTKHSLWNTPFFENSIFSDWVSCLHVDTKIGTE